jgi:hypothetical protein
MSDARLALTSLLNQEVELTGDGTADATTSTGVAPAPRIEIDPTDDHQHHSGELPPRVYRTGALVAARVDRAL